jgi:hypothetical protein
VAAVFRRRLSATFALLIAASVLLVTGPAAPALADPEGGTKTLRDALESAAKGQAEAIQKLNASKKRQGELQKTVVQAQASASALETQVDEIAGRAYRLGRTSAMGMLLDARSPDVFLERVQHLDMLGQLDGQILTRYRDDLTKAQQAKAAVEGEIKEQEKQVKALTKKKKEAELALGTVGGGGAAGGFLSVNSPLAKSAPRNSDGSWPKESCTITDPAGSGGCVTPRTLHAYKEARADGFTHYTTCFREQSSGEHGKGRACDFSANKSTFKNVAASGADKTYGNNLAAYFIKNADRLGVMYVIWFRQIWLPGSGWKAYSPSGGPSVVHTNHVHLSML